MTREDRIEQGTAYFAAYDHLLHPSAHRTVLLLGGVSCFAAATGKLIVWERDGWPDARPGDYTWKLEHYTDTMPRHQED